MGSRRQIDHVEGKTAFAAVASGNDSSRQSVATAVRYTLQQVEQLAPGRSVELRVPPFGAVQCVAGGTHTRGTPRATVETDAQSWIQLVAGQKTWHNLVASGKVTASGERSDLADVIDKVRQNMA